MQPGRRVADKQAGEAGRAPDRVDRGPMVAALFPNGTARMIGHGRGGNRMRGHSPGTVGGDGRADHRQNAPFLLQFLVMPRRLPGRDKAALG